MADFDVNTLNEMKSSTSQMQDFSNIFATFYYHKLINLPRRERKTSPLLYSTTYIYTNIPDCYDTGTSGSLKFLTQSDHYPIFTIRKSKTVLKPIEYIKQSPNDTAYKRWSCHSGFKLLCKLCRTSPPPAMGARFTVFLGMPAMRTRWMAGAAAHKSG